MPPGRDGRSTPTEGKDTTPPSPEEKYGNLWGLVYLATILILLITLVGKACLLSG